MTGAQLQLPSASRRVCAGSSSALHILQMPTQAGRQALVIFPPGSQSMEDIRYMLGQDNENEDMSSDHDVVTVRG